MLTALERYLKSYYNIASKFVWSNSTARACFIFLLCTLMTSPNISLKKKIFRRVENVIKQLVPTSAMRSLRYEALGKFREHSRSESCSQLRMFRALQTSRVLHISMNTRWRMNQWLIYNVHIHMIVYCVSLNIYLLSSKQLSDTLLIS